MADVYGPFASGTWSDGEWAKYAPTWAPSGPILAAGATTPSSATTGEWAFASSGLSVSAAAGRAWVRGFGLTRTGTPPSHAVTANTHATWSRRDRLILRRDLAAGTVTTAVKTGTAAASPTAPSLTQTETGVWEETLFSFLTPPGSGTNITGVVDERTWVRPDGRGYLIVPTPTAAGDLVPRSYLDAEIDAMRPKYMRAQRNVDTDFFPNNAWTAFGSDTNWTETDPHGMRSTGGTLVAPWTCPYQINATIYWASNTTGMRGVGLIPGAGVNIGEGAGQLVHLGYVASGGSGSIVVSGSHATTLTAGQSVQVAGFQNITGGSTLQVNAVRFSVIAYPGGS